MINTFYVIILKLSLNKKTSTLFFLKKMIKKKILTNLVILHVYKDILKYLERAEWVSCVNTFPQESICSRVTVYIYKIRPCVVLTVYE